MKSIGSSSDACRNRSLARGVGYFAFILVFVVGCNSDVAPTSNTTTVTEKNTSPKEKESVDGPTNLAGATDDRPEVDHVAKDTTRKIRKNRLANETSPYLLMHQNNPVDWYPWGEEALAKARNENKLIFLSIGYSSCHWCHVMEHESFMDEEIAAYLNENFVCIKVDREERPDLDAIFMTAVQIVNQGRGGWPMSVFLTPAGKPFWGGTYFPARDGDRPGVSGFFTIIQKLMESWGKEPGEVIKYGESLTVEIKKQMQGLSSQRESFTIDKKLIAQVQRHLTDQYDESHGGFGYNPMNPARPKFPEPSILFFLIQQAAQGDAHAQEMLVGTLDQMAQGGIRDHLGGGFHRYSTDRFWHIPHFEKMLYDNGQLASVYAATYELTGSEKYRHVVNELLEFIQREMRNSEGAFYAAIDADSEGVEGKFYRWQKEEIDVALSDEQLPVFNAVYGLDGPANFEHEYYVPQMADSMAQLGADLDIPEPELRQLLREATTKLTAVRNERKRPLTDTKILTSWNGLMIRGFADAGRILEEPRYIQIAADAGNFIWENLRGVDGHLLHAYSQGKATLNAYLDDYSFLANGFLAIYQATGDEIWLDRARQLTDEQIARFWDDEDGGFFFTSSDHESLLLRSKNPYDGARPSGNSVAAENLLLLADSFKDTDYRQRAEKTIGASLATLGGRIENCPRLATAIATYLNDSMPPTDDAKESTVDSVPVSTQPPDEKSSESAIDSVTDQ